MESLHHQTTVYAIRYPTGFYDCQPSAEPADYGRLGLVIYTDAGEARKVADTLGASIEKNELGLYCRKCYDKRTLLFVRMDGETYAASDVMLRAAGAVSHTTFGIKELEEHAPGEHASSPDAASPSATE